ncbi:hypothetical protein ACFL38_00935 [Candidatus Omnitrophota bacterium]
MENTSTKLSTRKRFPWMIISIVSLFLAILELTHIHFGLAFIFPPGSFARGLFLDFSPLGVIIQISPIYAPIVVFIAFLRNRRDEQPINKKVIFLILIGTLLYFSIFILGIIKTASTIDQDFPNSPHSEGAI